MFSKYTYFNTQAAPAFIFPFMLLLATFDPSFKSLLQLNMIFALAPNFLRHPRCIIAKPAVLNKQAGVDDYQLYILALTF